MRRSAIVLLVCLAGVVGATSVSNAGQTSSAATCALRYWHSGSLEETVVPHCGLHQRLPANSAHGPHLRGLLQRLRRRWPHRPGSYLRIRDDSTGRSLEMATASMGRSSMSAHTRTRYAYLYGIAYSGIAGRAYLAQAMWFLDGRMSYGLHRLDASRRPTRNGPGILFRPSRSGQPAQIVLVTPNASRIIGAASRTFPLANGLEMLLAATVRLVPPVRSPPVPTTIPRATEVPRGITAFIRAYDNRGWHPYSVGISPLEVVGWQNYDRSHAHPILCLQSRSTAPCPWAGVKQLPPATQSSSGLRPSLTTVQFPSAGTFTFEDAHDPSMQGQVLVVLAPPHR